MLKGLSTFLWRPSLPFVSHFAFNVICLPRVIKKQHDQAGNRGNCKAYLFHDKETKYAGA